ncbi:BQ5605_C037g11586 [Microbotryum silenes-dioicae]|uniref:mitogen-activated protein kinase kinase n=1 Tax=Microbotryum silenes-dioicae TaxID=796604 RepID=A0A2X0MF49_9BASI|nr:BQ5605_C037g11586 [Microbotryum silenes-dioicae]
MSDQNNTSNDPSARSSDPSTATNSTDAALIDSVARLDLDNGPPSNTSSTTSKVEHDVEIMSNGSVQGAEASRVLSAASGRPTLGTPAISEPSLSTASSSGTPILSASPPPIPNPIGSTTSPGAAPRPGGGVPPPLFPRATAPASLPPSAATRKAPLGPASSGLKAGVRGAPIGVGGAMKIPPSLAAKMAAMSSRNTTPSPNSPASAMASSPATPFSGTVPSGSTVSFRPSAPAAVPGRMTATGPAAGRGGGMMARRRAGPGLTLSAMGAGAATSSPGGDSPSTSGMISSGGDSGQSLPSVASPGARDGTGTPFSNFRKIVDPSGRLNFASKAVLHADGVDFSSGASFKIKMADFELFEELGQGNYGTVQKVWHKPTKVTMALKEIRLELDDSKLKTIITELDILHRATSPFIIDFYGAFFIESCVYYCMEYMDAGSLELFAGCDVPENVLARVTSSIVHGLKFLKDELAIMHRDVKPTNVLINRRGFVKLCDFGVSGQLDRSMAKTNIGCQSYMAPERIKGESQGVASTYTASSDVWSLGLSIIEFAIGHYPYPPETYSNVFAQLTAIVHGDPPALPTRYSETARDFVMGCLEKSAVRRPNYAQLLEHPFLKEDVGREVDMVQWVVDALAYRAEHPKIATVALA